MPTKAEFFSHMLEHKERVRTHAVEILKNYPDLFPHLNALPEATRLKFIGIYLSTHDQPKIMSLDELTALGYRGQRPIFDKLYENWGKALKRRPPFIQELNNIEDRYKDIVMKRHFGTMDQAVYNNLLQEVKWMEYVADETDAKVSRGPELGVETKPFDAEKMFRDSYKDEQGAKVSKWLEMKFYKRSYLNFCEAHFHTSGK